ncbi:hypothetical protein [Paenibacillus sp.]|uniref:hypothetical protein n=1 Tax=Paenibacillus sp. TaxID=58172 RepID=UPI002811508E|nr:hypothetical protein [Paenibacillus sp.]
MNESGSIALEAAFALPLLLCIGVALSWLLLTARTESLVREAVDEAVRTTAAHAYPLDLLARVYHESDYVRNIENQVGRFLPYSVKAMFQERKQSGGSGEAEAVERAWSESDFHRAWAEPFVMSFVDRGADGEPLLDSERLVVKSTLIPTFVSEDTSYFGLSVEYRMTLPIPFFSPEIVFRAAAMERCWVGEKLGGQT